MSTDCITDDALAAWADGKATDEAVAQMTAHVAGCDTCRVVLAEVARSSGERPAPQTLGRYQLQEKVGAGGMGTVWAAWDPTLGRRVAVKLIHEAAGDGAHRAQRFLHERQVLAGLEHPHIARLLDAGETAEGRPWFAMDFVDGQPLDQYCDARRLTIRQRLALLLPVFDAVSYAHQHLVVHRDLKPGNILVGADGAPRLVDFGIARLLEAEGALTQTGLTPMTPAYASPEQVRHEPVATTSDVYSLGVVLFETLTGVSPYDVPSGELDALLTAVRDQEPAAPSVALSRAPAQAVECRATSRERLGRELRVEGLDAIVLMALRKEPKDRYPSVLALADDVHAALEGRSTVARRGTTAYRALRFVRRHKASVAAVSAALLSLVAGLVSTLWQAQRAERERDTAQRRFTQVRALAHAVLFDYHDGMAGLPGSTPLRERVVKDAQVYLDGLLSEAQGDLSLRRELAQGFLKLGDVQGDPFAASLGDLTAAKGSYLRARSLAEALTALEPADWDARRVIASSHEKVGAVLEVSGDLRQALAEYDLARTLDDALATERPGDLDQRTTASRDDLAAGQVLLQLGDLDAASLRLERALAARKYVLENRVDPGTRRGVATVLVSLTDVRQEQGRLDEALAHAEEAERMLAALAVERPDDADAQRGVSRAWAGLAGLYRIARQPERAVAVSRKSVAQARKAVAADPANSVARRDLTTALGNLGMALSAQHAWQELAPVEEEALALQRALSHDEPDNLQYHRDLLSLLAMAAPGALERGELGVAEARAQEQLTVAAALAATPALNVGAQEDGVMAHSFLGTVRAAQHRYDEAITENRLAMAGLEALLRENPTLERVRVRLAIARSAEGEYRVRQAERAAAPKRRAAWELALATLTSALEEAAAIERAGHATGTLQRSNDETRALIEQCKTALARKP